MSEEDGHVGADVAPSATGERRGYDCDEHDLSPLAVAERYGTPINWANISASAGLSAAQVEERRATYGLNQLTPPQETPEWLKFVKQFTNPLMVLLIIAGGLLLMAYGIQAPNNVPGNINNVILAVALLLVVLITCVTSYMQERSASNVMASLKSMLPARCTVYRDGSELKVEASELVPGDLVRLYIGDRVPADVRIIETADLKTEQSALTGEADLVPATVDKAHDQAAEARNIVFMSTLVMNGEGRGIVVRTGDQTFIGCIASLATETSGHKSTLQVEVHRLVIFVSSVAFVTGLILFFIGLGRGYDRLNAFVNGFILVLVANVPEGLPTTVTTCLTLTAVRLKERNVLVKRTDIIENLGVASVIASDKTGTLTQNKMTVENVWCNCELHKAATYLPVGTPAHQTLASMARLSRRTQGLQRASRALTALAKRSVGLGKSSVRLSMEKTMSLGRSSVYRPDGTVDFNASAATSVPLPRASLLAKPASPFEVQSWQSLDAIRWDFSSDLMRLVAIATVVNKARFGSAERGDATAVVMPEAFRVDGTDQREVLGDATDIGLLRYVDRMANSGLVRLAYEKLFDIPFNSANKWALTVTRSPGVAGQHLVMMKGAPEIVLTKCSHYLREGAEHPIDDAFRAKMTAGYERCGFAGERVLGFAYKAVPAQPAEAYKTEEGAPPSEGLVFAGLLSLVDPPKEGVLQAVQKCRGAGIAVYMVTGDHPLTAEAIARKVGIVTLPTRREVAAEAGVSIDDIPLTDQRVGAAIVTGQQLREMTSQEEWDEILDVPEIVFARTSPQQKLQIVEHLQRRGEIVAVTGDGVNDAPALKKAQIGVAMGQGGSDVAREAAAIVLMDDQFATIVVAIEEGRTIYDNLKKTIAYTLAHAVPEVFPIFLAIALNMPLGLQGLMILSIDLITEQGPAISLAYEHTEGDVMLRPPRDPKVDRLIDSRLLRYAYMIAGAMEAAVCMIAFFTVFWWRGVPIANIFNNGDKQWLMESPPLVTNVCDADAAGNQVCKILSGEEQWAIYTEAHTAWYITLVMCQFWHIWVCKTRQVSIFKHGLFKNLVTIMGVIISLGVMLVIAYAPFLQPIFLSHYLTGIAWLPQLIFLLWVVPYTEFSKAMMRNAPDSWWARNMHW